MLAMPSTSSKQPAMMPPCTHPGGPSYAAPNVACAVIVWSCTSQSRGTDSGLYQPIIGEKGKLYTPRDYGYDGKLLGELTPPEVTFPESPGHFAEWVRAIKEGKPAMSNFPDYSGPLTETVLLGNLAVWADGKKIEWDARNLQATNAPEVSEIIRPKYRNGYSV